MNQPRSVSLLIILILGLTVTAIHGLDSTNPFSLIPARGDVPVCVLAANIQVRRSYWVALTNWAKMINFHWHYSNDIGHCLVIADRASYPAEAEFLDIEYRDRWLQATMLKENIILINTQWDQEDDAFISARHELGHVFGLGHSLDHKSIMYGGPDRLKEYEMEITKSDMKSLSYMQTVRTKEEAGAYRPEDYGMDYMPTLAIFSKPFYWNPLEMRHDDCFDVGNTEYCQAGISMLRKGSVF